MEVIDLFVQKYGLNVNAFIFQTLVWNQQFAKFGWKEICSHLSWWLRWHLDTCWSMIDLPLVERDAWMQLMINISNSVKMTNCTFNLRNLISSGTSCQSRNLAECSHTFAVLKIAISNSVCVVVVTILVVAIYCLFLFHIEEWFITFSSSILFISAFFFTKPLSSMRKESLERMEHYQKRNKLPFKRRNSIKCKKNKTKSVHRNGTN